MKRFSTIVILFLAALAGSPAMAQNFPVRVTPILTPPYTPFLTDYTDPGAERMTLQIILNDITVPEFRVKLRMTIEGVGITITTNPNYLPAPITLQGGVPELIFGSDIADYFRFSNLVFQGLNPNELQSNGGRLPEGVYRFSFEVLDYNRNTVISNRGSATAWMILNDPPFINLPVNNMKIKPLNPQNIVFQWTPRHRGSPNAAFTTEYDVKLVEIWPAGRNPFDAINTSRPILETTTSTTLLVYGPAETPLVLGRQYALQVRARDTGGRDVFKNNGYSEVISFVYGDQCPLPSGLNVDDVNTAKARIRWQGNGQNSDYLLRYREKKEGARWFEERTDQSYHNATGLRPGTTYEYQLVGGCDIYESEETTIESFTTLLENPNAFVCADPNTVPPPDGSPPLPALFTNDFIHAGGFDVVVNKATGSNGRFSGEGLAVVPWFNSAKVKVTFENIGVNTSYQLTAGEIKSVWDPNSRFLVESEKTLAEGGGKGLESSLGVFEADTLIALPGIILSVAVHPESGDIMIETRDGPVVISREEAKTVAITDEAGNGYLVDKDGKVTKTTATDAQLAGARGEREYSTDPDLQVDFKKADQTKYGLDDYQSVLTQNYQQTENGKYISWKALATGQTDQVAAFAPGNGDITKAIFQTGPDAQPLSPSTQSPNTQVLTLTGKTDGMVDELLAYYPNPDTSKSPLVAGKLNLISYDIERKSLVLVSVNGTAASGIGNLQQRLNEIYGQGVVEWTSVQQQNVTVSGIDETNIDDGGSGLLSNYTDDMKKILRAYTDGNSLAENTYYLFLVKNSTSKSKLGYMPRKRQAGFIFTEAHNGEDIILTMAHELGHGAFHLKHTFSEYSLSQGVTENLMDYPAKTRLDKWQWDYMHNPEAVLGLFEDDEEGALVKPDLSDLTSELLVEIRNSNLNKRRQLDISIFGGLSFQYFNHSLGNEKLRVLSVDVASIGRNPLQSMDPLKIDPGEIFFEDINEWNGSIDPYLKIVFHKDGINENNLIGPQTREISRAIEIIVSREDQNKLLMYLFGLTMDDIIKQKERIIGERIIEIAKDIDAVDQRLYRQVVEDNGRLSDEYVDCAEFVYDVLKRFGSTPPSGDCVFQFNWFKANGFRWGTDVRQVMKGDILLWDNPNETTKDLNHTGFALEDYNNSDIPIVHSGLNKCNCGGYDYPVYKLNEQGDFELKDGQKIVVYEAVSDCDKECVEKSYFSIYILNNYIKSTGNTKNGDLEFMYWVRPKRIAK